MFLTKKLKVIFKNKIIYYKIYCDGSASIAHGMGGIGIFVTLYNDDDVEIESKEISEGFKDVTNNQMELLAAIKSLQYIKDKKTKTILITDSQYTTKGLLEWYENWQKNGKDYKNKELWDELYIEYKKFVNIEIVHTKGHKKGSQEHILGNNIVDKLASYKQFINEKSNND